MGQESSKHAWNYYFKQFQSYLQAISANECEISETEIQVFKLWRLFCALSAFGIMTNILHWYLQLLVCLVFCKTRLSLMTFKMFFQIGLVPLPNSLLKFVRFMSHYFFRIAKFCAILTSWSQTTQVSFLGKRRRRMLFWCACSSVSVEGKVHQIIKWQKILLHFRKEMSFWFNILNFKFRHFL